MKPDFFNGPLHKGCVAMIGGPYESREAATEALNVDQQFTDKHYPAADPWWKWFAVKVEHPEEIVTFRERVRQFEAGEIPALKGPTLVRFSA